MTKNFYTNVQSWGNHVLFRGVVNGKRVKEKIEYSPSFYTPSKKPTEFKNLHGEYLERKKFEDINSAKEFVKKFDGVSNASTIYGNAQFGYAYIADNYQEDIEWSINDIVVGVIDIEVGSENGFPDPYKAEEPITAICLTFLNGGTFVFGCGDYSVQGEETYIKCSDEYHLCRTFLAFWVKHYPDIVTGWYTKFFDIPYLVNRFNRILGEEETRKLSPWRFISERDTVIMGRNMKSYEFKGVASLDYLELYAWYAPNGKTQATKRLDVIANLELGERKLSYDEYDSLHELYKQNYQKFIEYNIRDVYLVVRLEEKLELVQMAIALAYDTKSNYEDVFAQTRMWDSMTNTYLLQRKIIVPPKITQSKDHAFEGAYVKEPQIGLHPYVSAFDLDALYSHLMMQYNISPETLIEPRDYTPAMRDIISDGINVDKLLSKEVNLNHLLGATVTPSGQFFSTNQGRGFLPQMLEEMYDDRKKFKKLMLQAKKDLENEKDESKKFNIEKRISKYNNLQLAKKVSLNSAYGALGSQYFRFYDLRLALAVTSAGQLSIRWIENKINEYMNKILKTDGEDYVIASDTDSIYLRMGPLVDKVFGDNKPEVGKIIDFMDKVCEEKIGKHIAKSYQELADYVHAYAQKMRMKREVLADKGIWTAKKRYILNVYDNEGVRYHEPVMKVMGLEMIKSSTPDAIRKKMSELIKILLSGTESDVHKFIAEAKRDFLKLEPEEVSFPRGVNGISKYSDSLKLYKLGTPIHVKGAILYNDFIRKNNLTKKYPLIQEGDKIKFAYLKMPNTLKDTVVSFPDRLPKEMALDDYIDYDMQFDKTFLEPIKVILDCVGWKTEKQSSLEDFFN